VQNKTRCQQILQNVLVAKKATRIEIKLSKLF
jgi:hypothetical protein